MIHSPFCLTKSRFASLELLMTVKSMFFSVLHLHVFKHILLKYAEILICQSFILNLAIIVPTSRHELSTQFLCTSRMLVAMHEHGACDHIYTYSDCFKKYVCHCLLDVSGAIILNICVCAHVICQHLRIVVPESRRHVICTSTTLSTLCAYVATPGSQCAPYLLKNKHFKNKETQL